MLPDAPLPGAEERAQQTPLASDGSRPGPVSTPPPPIPDHELIRLIAQGSYGEVWLARSALGTWRAVKIVHRCTFWHDHPFEREFKGIQKFEPISRSHEGLVDILQVGRGDGFFYYVMELADDANSERETRSAEFPEGSAGSVPHSALRVPSSYSPRTLSSELHARGRLPLDECLHIGRSLASALEHLHQHSLVHRDVKPSNVIFVGGVPKLADIGMVAEVSEARSYVGTEGFIPPEGPGTPQADLYSLGKLLYELSTGKDRHEFPALPPNLDQLPDKQQLVELNAVLLKACDPEPPRRYASAEALEADLVRLQRGGSVRRRHRLAGAARLGRRALPALAMIALLSLLLLPRMLRQPDGAAAPSGASVFVLPFRNEGTNGAPFELCSRITDAFIDSLALLKDQGITVGPRKSGWVHQEESVLLKRVAADSGMRHALTGRVGLARDRYELTLTLQDLHTGKPRWTETFSGGTNDLIELERLALAKIVSSLGTELTPERAGQISQLLTNNLEALDWLQRAKALYAAKGSFQPVCIAVKRLTQQALQRDPRYLDADFFDMYMLRLIAQERDPTEMWIEVARRADAILGQDDTYASALDQRAGYALLYEGDWAAFDALSQRCLQSNSGPGLHFMRAFYLRINGRFDEARIEQAKCENPEPTDPDQRGFMSFSRWADRDYDGAIRAARRTLEIYPGNPFDAYFLLAHNLVAKGDCVAGMEMVRAAQAIWNKQELTALAAFTYARMGQPDKAREVLQELLAQQTSRPYLQPYFVARVYAALGDKQTALDWLEKAAAEHSEYLFYPDWGGLRTDYAWDSLQDNEPRYWKLCEQLGLGKDQWPRKVTPAQ